MVDTNLRLAARTKTYQRQQAMYQWTTGGCAAAALVWKLTDKSLSTWGLVPPGTLVVSIGSGRAPIKAEWWGYPLLVVDDLDGNQLLLPRYDKSA